MHELSADETSPLTISETSPTKKKNCCQILREEFRWNSFGFDFPKADVFYKSQWRWPRLVFVIFRLCLALYLGIFCILTIVYFPRTNPQRPWVSWMTNWSYLLLTCHEIYATAIVLIHSTEGTTGYCCRELEDGADKGDDHPGTSRRVLDRRRDDDLNPVPCYMKLGWLLFCTTSPVSIVVTISNLQASNGGPISVKSLNNHILNSVVVLLEFCICALPVRLFHFVYGVIFFILYFLFTYIVWSFDHTFNVLYSFADWDNPRDVVINWVVLGLVMPLVVQIILFLIYRLRLLIFAKIYGDEERGYEEVYGY